MPKGQQRKIKGAICSVPAECDKTCQTLPRGGNRTIIAEPLPDDIADELKQPILEKQKEILTSVKEKINSVLNSSKPEDYDPNLTEADIFNSLGITQEEY